jgi:hypothetical protein
MKKLVLGSILTASIFSLAATADTLTGFIADSKCAAKHAGTGAKDVACSKACIKGGADPVLVSDGKVLKFDADSKAKAAEHAGETVTIDGSTSGDTVTITSIAAASK